MTTMRATIVGLALVGLVGLAGPAAAQATYHTVWQGRYVCAQGTTALTLVLDTTTDGATTGSFEFSAVKDNPGVPSGAYRVRGQLTKVDGVVELVLSPERWTHQPPGYIMVGLTVRSDRERRSLRGKITDPSCGEVSVSRVE